ncbi:Rok-like winged helix domain-containing protein, partial [Jeotgalibacillus campisalis]|uniref:Competence protein ComK n=1 Tax=Jeotgalibacillus campisalis TaxID=220754 RepID=A0A0C2VG97_9BACL
MFNERIALKLRLEQMADSEERILQEFRKERQSIMERLRELDLSQGEYTESNLQEPSEIEPYTSSNESIFLPHPTTKRIPKTKKIGKSRQMHEAAFKILKERLQPVKGTEIQDYILSETGFKVANMTTFMKTIQRKDKQVRKLDRGLYIFEKES